MFTDMQVIEVVRKVSPHIQASIVMFTYFNPIMRRGAEQFCREIKEAGASGQTTTKPPSAKKKSSPCQAYTAVKTRDSDILRPYRPSLG